MCVSYRHNKGDTKHYVIRNGDGLIDAEFKTEDEAKRAITISKLKAVIEQRKMENWTRLRKLLPIYHSLYLEERTVNNVI